MITVNETDIASLKRRKALLERKRSLLKSRISRKPDTIDKVLPTQIAERFGRGKADFKKGEMNIWGDVFDRPGAVSRAVLQKQPLLGAVSPALSGLIGASGIAGKDIQQAAKKAAIDPKSVPTFAQLSQQYPNPPVAPLSEGTGVGAKARNAALMYQQFASGLGRDVASFGADIITNPADILTMMGSNAAVKAIGKTKVGQAVGRWLNKPRKFFKFKKDTVQKVAEQADRGKKIILEEKRGKYDQLFNEMDEALGDKQLDVIQANIDLADDINNVINTYPDSPNMPKLRKMAARLEANPKISGRELHNFKQEIRRVVPKSVWRGTTSADPMQKAQRDLYFKVSKAIESLDDTGKYAGLSGEYKEFMDTVDDLNSAILERGRPGEQVLRSDAPTIGKLFDPNKGLTYRQREALRTVNNMLPPEEQFLQDFNAWKRGILLKDLIYGIGAAGAIYGARRKVGENTTLNMGEDEGYR